MKPSHYIEKVKKSNEYKLMMEEDPKAYLCSVFFLRDFDEGNNETQVDFYSPAKKQIVSFKVDKKVEKTESKKMQTITHKKFIPKPLNENIRMDIDEMKSTLTDEMHNRDMTYEIEKILVFLNITDGRAVWNCTGFLKGLGLVQAHVEDESASVLFMEKKSLFDLIKFPGGAPGLTPPGMPGGLTGNIAVTTNPEVIPSETESKPKTEKTNSEPKKKDAKSK